MDTEAYHCLSLDRLGRRGSFLWLLFGHGLGWLPVRAHEAKSGLNALLQPLSGVTLEVGEDVPVELQKVLDLFAAFSLACTFALHAAPLAHLTSLAIVYLP